MKRTTAALAAAVGLTLASCGSGGEVRVVEEDPATRVLDAPTTARTEPTPPARIDPPTVTDTSSDAERDRIAAAIDAANAAMAAGDCVAAIAGFDAILEDPEWRPTGREVADLTSRREVCSDFLDVTARPPSPEALTGLLEFRRDRPDSGLTDAVDRAIEQLYRDHGAAVLSADSCSSIDGRFELLADPLAVDAMAVCATAFAGAGMTADAIALAYEAVDLTDDPLTVDMAIQVVRDDPELCGLLAAGIEVADPIRWPEHHAGLLSGCMDDVAAADDLEQLARLQLTFLGDLPDHPDAAGVTAALLDNVGACGHLGELDSLPLTAELVASKLLSCARFAEYVGDLAEAIELFESFLEEHADDSRLPEATAGLARNLIALAREGDWTGRDRPDRAGSTGGDRAVLVYSNDTRYEQRITISGPEARVLAVEASSTSSVYDVPPSGCRSDVPTVVIDLAPGTYDVMVADDVADPEIGTWQLSGGSEYGWCSFYVWA